MDVERRGKGVRRDERGWKTCVSVCVRVCGWGMDKGYECVCFGRVCPCSTLLISDIVLVRKYTLFYAYSVI